VEKPNKDATRSDWDEYAQSLGLDPEEYSNKEALVEAVEAEEVAQGIDDDDDDEPDEKPAKKSKSKKGDFEHSDWPDEFDDSPDTWKRAFSHARSKGNPVKTSVQFANSQHSAEEFSG
jgi:hypothetical protein